MNHSKKRSFAIINPWPGGMSAELEVVFRIQKAAENAGYTCFIVDNLGTILEGEKCERSEKQLNPDDVEFVISTHYDTPKVLDAFYMHTVWNPPEIPLRLPNYISGITNNYLQNDDYLIYDAGGMSNHLRSILINKPRTLEDASMLTSSFPKTALLEPQLQDPKMFYCGMNWEKVNNVSQRHEGLFKLLDDTGKVKFFGPDKVKEWGGVRPWEGYKSYQYPIPFDGFSILKEINECGVCLVISSDIHRRAGAVTNRAYEACAAGAVMISDENVFMKKYFSDAALFIDYNRKKPEDTFNQIMEKFHWIESHPEEALQLVRRAQEIFKTTFALEKQLTDIFNHLERRKETIAKDLFALDENGKVVVTYIANTVDTEFFAEAIKQVVANVKRQFYKNIELVIVADSSIADSINDLMSGVMVSYRIVGLPLFDAKKVRCLTDGQAFVAVRNTVEHDYITIMSSAEVWFKDHITTLVRTMQDENSVLAYSGIGLKGDDGNRPYFFDEYSAADLFNMASPDDRVFYVPGQALIAKQAHSFLPDYLFDNIDGLEKIAYENILKIKYQQGISFSKRTTILLDCNVQPKIAEVVPLSCQINLIRDSVRFELKRCSVAMDNGGGISEAVVRYNLYFPVKKYLRSKKYEKLSRIFKNGPFGNYIQRKRAIADADFLNFRL